MDPSFAGPVSGSLFALLAFALALLYAATAWRWVGRPGASAAGPGRAVAIDGLRGFLAFGVFLHHRAIWYGYLHEGRWQDPDSPLYAHLGDSAVFLFFMITAFLFFGKILDARTRSIGWTALFVGRAFRLMPLYLLMVSALTVIVFAKSGFAMRTGLGLFAKEWIKWAGLAVFGASDLNGLENTWQIDARVQWTLLYECLFYLALPLIACLTRRRGASAALVAVTTVFAVAIAWFNAPYLIPYPVLAFACGMGAAWTARRRRWQAWSRGRAASSLAIACAVVAVVVVPDGYSVGAIVLFGVSFAIVAAGNTLFGTLGSRAALGLGEIAYGIYLFHGLALYVVFEFMIGHRVAATLSPVAYGAVVLACGFIVLAVATLAHVAVEKPAIALGRRVASWLGRAPEAIPGLRRVPERVR